MDLTYLIHREGEERLRAVHAVCGQARDAHLVMAESYRDRIADGRADTGPGAASR